MLNIDPHLFQPKVIRLQTTESIGHHLMRTTLHSNSQIMTGIANRVQEEANNNILADGEYEGRRQSFHDSESEPPTQWTPEQMAWSGGEVSMMSFQSTLSDSVASSEDPEEHSKEEEVISQLKEARSCSPEEASKLLLKMTYSGGNCLLMRQCGCLPLLVELLHGQDDNSNLYQREYLEVRRNAAQALRSVVLAQQRPDDKRSRREGRVLRYLEEIRDYSDQLLCAEGNVDNRTASFVDQNLVPCVAALMKLSFDEDHRHAMCQLGGLQAIAELLRVDQWAHGVNNDPHCTTLRRYLGMSLTNLTFGDGANKALLCSMRPFMEALVAQLYSPSEDLRQVTASVLRNLSWRADPPSKRALRDVGAVPSLVRAALSARKDSTLKSVLSALWNLSAHCSANKADICREEGALPFLVSALTHKTLAIVENGGGILRNVSSHVAIQNEYRAILRKHNCLQILLVHLKSPSLTVVSNACGTLWNLSARNATDQRALWEMGAVAMLRKLVNSRHKMISMGSSAALKNLLSARPPGAGLCLMAEEGGVFRDENAPSLSVRKQKALSTEIDQNLSETYDNTDSPKTSPVKHAENTQGRSRRHISPSAARYLANQRLKSELTLPSKEEQSMTGSFVVEEKHNGAFQVTKNAKQALNYRQGQQAKLQVNPAKIPEPDSGPKLSFKPIKTQEPKIPDVQTTFEPGSKLMFKPAKMEGPKLQNHIPEPGSKLSFRPARYDRDVPKPSDDMARQASRSMSPMTVRKGHSAPPSRAVEQAKPAPEANQKPMHESRIPLPKSSASRLECQRSQSASPVAPRKNLRQENTPKCPAQKPQQAPPPPVDITVTHPKWAWSASPEKSDNVPECPSKRLDEEESGGEDEVRVWRTEDTPLMSSTNNLEREEPGARCSLNIRTNTGVKMIRQHPLLVNAHRNDEEGRLFEHRSRDEDYESGRTVEFCVQGEYDIDDALSLMSRSSSVASISSFASDLSHRTSGIESPSELSDSPCQTAPTSPMSNYISVCCDVSDEVQTRSAADRMDLLEVEVPQEEEIPEDAHSDEPPAPAEKVHSDHIDVPAHSSYVEVERRISRASSSSSFSVEDASPSERAMLEECIRAGLPLAPPSYQLLGDASIHLATAHREQGEEKGKEDERKAEKNRLFRIPESPGVLEDKKAVLDQVGNRRSEKQRVKDVPNQLEFLMKGDKNIMSNNELAETTKHSEPQESYRASVDTESALPADEPVNFVDKPSVEEAPEDILKSEEEEEAAEKDIDCSESDEVMLTSSLLGEAREIAQLLAAGSTEDMTVSTLSCLSDIDNARPPSAMGELHCLSADDSIRTTQLLSKQLSSKKSLLRELQLGRLASSTDSPDNLSLRSSCTSDLLANVNPPSILDNVSLSSSMESEGGDEKEPAPQKDSLSERMHEAAAMAQMCARELSAITGGGAEKREERGQIRIPVAVQQQEVTIADVTDIGWGSDTEVEEDLPCDDEETLRAVTRDEGSSENLTFTLTEEQPRPLMTSEEFRALQENAHRVLRTLRDVEVSDDDDDGGHSGDLLDDETMSLVSNGSDEDSPKASPTCNNGLPRPKATATFPHSLDTRTFTRKRASVPRDMVPTVRSPASEVPRPLVQSKVAGAWKGRSKSADVSRNAKIKVAPPAGPLQRNEDRNGSSPRSTPSPKSPLSRSGTFERLSDAETSPTPAIRRPSSLAIANRTRSAPSQKHANDRPRPSILSPSGGIPRKTSGIPAPRRSMIPMPAKFGTQEN